MHLIVVVIIYKRYATTVVLIEDISLIYHNTLKDEDV